MDSLSPIRDRLRSHGEVVFAVHVRPSSAKTALRPSLANGTLRLTVAAPPEHNKANAAVIRFFSRELGVPPSGFQMLSGQSSSKKIFRVQV